MCYAREGMPLDPVTVLPTVVDEDKQKDEQVSDVLEGATLPSVT
jgi:hypothetical protein